MDDLECFEITAAYATALFGLQRYEQHLTAADRAIEMSVADNITYIDSVDIYKKTLFEKAQSYFYLTQYGASKHILQELLKMDATDEQARSILKKCLNCQNVNMVSGSRAYAVALFLVAASTSGFTVLVVEPFWEDYTLGAEISCLSFFVGGWVILLAGEWRRRAKTIQKIKNVTKLT